MNGIRMRGDPPYLSFKLLSQEFFSQKRLNISMKFSTLSPDKSPFFPGHYSNLNASVAMLILLLSVSSYI